MGWKYTNDLCRHLMQAQVVSGEYKYRGTGKDNNINKNDWTLE